MTELRELILVTGGASSGKSLWGEQWAQRLGDPVIYIATARGDAADREWEQKLQAHRDRRPPQWTTWEVPEDLGGAIRRGKVGQTLLIDALGTWVANLLDNDRPTWETHQTALIASLGDRQSHVILIGEEVGWGLVPPYPAGRLFRDRLGQLTQAIAPHCTQVYTLMAGHVLPLHHLGRPLGNVSSG